MLITDEIFRDFLVCESKAYLKLSGHVGSQREFTDWQQSRFEEFKQKCLKEFRSNFGEYAYPLNISPQDLEKSKYHFIADYTLKIQDFQSQIDVLERYKDSNSTDAFLIPIRFVPNEKITKNDRLSLAFNAFVLSIASGKMPIFGRIIHGAENKTVKVKFSGMIETIRTIIKKITAQHKNSNPP